MYLFMLFIFLYLCCLYIILYHYVSSFLRHPLFSFLMQHLEMIYSIIIYIQFYSILEVSPETLYLNINFNFSKFSVISNRQESICDNLLIKKTSRIVECAYCFSYTRNMQRQYSNLKKDLWN